VKTAAYLGTLFGLAVLIGLGVHANLAVLLHTLALGSWNLFWLVPYRGLYFVLYAIGWYALLRPYDPGRSADFGYVLWVTTVREAVDRLLPVASVGGGIAGVRLLRWRGIGAVPATATVIVEVLLTVMVLYLFTALGLLSLLGLKSGIGQFSRLSIGFLCSLPIPLITTLLLCYGSVFSRIQGTLGRLAGLGVAAESAATGLDQAVQTCLRHGGVLSFAGSLQFAAWTTGAFEIWFSLRLFGHPIGSGAALMLESLTQAMRHIAFLIPAGIGVQEVGLTMFGQLLGISSELALAVSMAKRMRELLCGLPPLLCWLWLESRRPIAPGSGPLG
jgi:putative membrane protein